MTIREHELALAITEARGALIYQTWKMVKLIGPTSLQCLHERRIKLAVLEAALLRETVELFGFGAVHGRSRRFGVVQHIIIIGGRL